MADFTVTERSDTGGAKPRFDHDFDITLGNSSPPSAAELAYLADIRGALDHLGTDAAKEAGADLRDTITSARKQWRQSSVDKLRADADRFAAGNLDAEQAKANVAAVMADYGKGIPDAVLTAVVPPVYPGQLRLDFSTFTPDPAERTYLVQLQDLLETLNREDAEDVAANYDAVALAVRREQRTLVSKELERDFANWRSGFSSEDSASNVSFVRGGYRALRDNLGRPLFFVDVKEGVGTTDLIIHVEPNLPGPAGVPSVDQQNLFVQIENADTVIDAVCRQISARRNETKRATDLRKEYVNKLAGIARVGLQGPHTALAALALTNLKAEFVAREAARIFNRYLWRLGAWSIGFAVVFLIAYLIIRAGGCTDKDTCKPCATHCVSWWDQHKTFLLVCVGASLGTWASFSVRQVNLTFEQLIAPEENVADPPLRIIFVVILALAACLLFWNDAINVKIGNLNTEPGIFKTNGTVALLIGFFCGLSERALALAISGRASSFVGGIAGSR